MKVSIIGHKHLGPNDPQIIAAKMLQTVADPDVEEIFFPGIDGVGACALACAVQARENNRTPILTVVFPGKLGQRPWSVSRPSPEEWSARADRVLELGGEMKSVWIHRAIGGHFAWQRSMDACYEYVIDQVVDCGQVLAFWDGSGTAGTFRAVRYLQEKFVAWEHIKITGEL